MTKPLTIGLIGLDTSHVPAFAGLLNDPNKEYHVPGAKVVVAYPGVPAKDFELSYSRVEGYTNELCDKFGVHIVDSAEAVAEACDAVMLESVDGRVHLELFRRIAPFGKPVFVDKPFALSTAEASAIIDLAKQYQIPLMSCSSLRYSEALIEALEQAGNETLIGADCYGPMALQPTQPGLYWYGIHMTEMLFSILGKGCTQVTVTTTEDHDLVVGVWEDGRIGTVRGNRKGNGKFGALIHREQGSEFVDVYAHPKPYYASMLENIMEMFQTGKEPIDLEETLQIIRFIEAANESRLTGKTVKLN